MKRYLVYYGFELFFKLNYHNSVNKIKNNLKEEKFYEKTCKENF